MASSTSHVPTQLGNYDVLSKIAEGGMGAVYKGRSRATGELVAIKVIAQNTAKNPVLLQRFEREFQAAKLLEHPNVVRAVDYCGTGPHPFLVMEFVDGESVGQRVERDGAIPEAEAVRIIAQVCEGLQRAHKQGLVHRDVKPDNILLTRDGVAKLTDLGLVKDLEGEDLNLTKTGRGLGTPHYMAPEQFRNAKGVDVRGDVYSLGATLYAMVTGQVPFGNASPLDCWLKKMRGEFPPPKQLNKAVSDRVDWAICRAMKQEPADRPASCREFLEDLTGQTRPSASPALIPQPAAADLWYMVYKDDAGQTHTVKGQTEGIRRALKDGLLGDAGNVLVSRTKGGQFISLHSVAEFRDLVASPTPATVGAPPPRATASGAVPRPGVRPPSDGFGPKGVSDSGLMPTPAARPGLGADEADAGRGSRAGRPGAGGRPAPFSVPTPAGDPDPQAETMQYTAMPAPVRGPADRRPTPAAAGPADEEAKGFDPTPILVGLVAILSAAVGYLLFFK